MQSFQIWFEQWAAHLRWQADKLAELEGGLKQLKEEVAAIKQRPPVHVDKIEYNFDQLKIETLEGTLHIGVSPPGEKTIDDFVVQGEPIGLSDPEFYARLQTIKDELDQYLASECWEELRQLEAEHQLILGLNYRDAMIRDLRGQVHQRIEHYASRRRPGAQGREDGGAAPMEHIPELVKRDIRTALRQHLEKIKQAE